MNTIHCGIAAVITASAERSLRADWEPKRSDARTRADVGADATGRWQPVRGSGLAQAVIGFLASRAMGRGHRALVRYEA